MTSDTNVALLAATLPGQAWLALLEGRPGIHVAAARDPAHIADLVLPAPSTIMVDRPDGHLAMAAQLRAACPDAGLLFLVDAYTLSDSLALLRAGASGCLSRDGTVAELVSALVAAGRGEIVLPPAYAARALAALARGATLTEPPAVALSGRESDVLELLAQGLTNKDIAQTLFLSVRTVEAHLRSIFDKLGTRTRTEAALWAVGHGYGDGSVNSPN